jgi:hypothetical protein
MVYRHGSFGALRASELKDVEVHRLVYKIQTNISDFLAMREASIQARFMRRHLGMADTITTLLRQTTTHDHKLTALQARRYLVAAGVPRMNCVPTGPPHIDCSMARNVSRSGGPSISMTPFRLKALSASPLSDGVSHRRFGPRPKPAQQ